MYQPVDEFTSKAEIYPSSLERILRIMEHGGGGYAGIGPYSFVAKTKHQ
jgi:hypothetical protein